MENNIVISVVDNIVEENKPESLDVVENQPVIVEEELKTDAPLIVDDNTENENQNIIIDYDTIVLSGGGIQGIMLLGSIQYLYDNFLINNIKNYIGTSCGAIISYLLIIGYTPVEIIVYFCKNRTIEKINENLNIASAINDGSLCSFNFIHEELEKMTILKIGSLLNLQELYNRFNKKLICATYNLTEEKTEYLSIDTYPNLPCITALRMSSNLPFIFEKYKYGNSFYIDGGISNNFPLDLGEIIGKKVLGILLFPLKQNSDNKEQNLNFIEYFYKLLGIFYSELVQCKLNTFSTKTKICKLFYKRSGLTNFSYISPVDRLEMFSEGYQQIRAYL